MDFTNNLLSLYFFLAKLHNLRILKGVQLCTYDVLRVHNYTYVILNFFLNAFYSKSHHKNSHKSYLGKIPHYKELFAIYEKCLLSCAVKQDSKQIENNQKVGEKES